MEITLPIQKAKLENGKKVVMSKEEIFDLDMTLAAQIRYEAKFPELAKHEDLYGYTKRILEQPLSQAKIISLLKTLYCWFDTNIQFIDFVKLFDFTDRNYIGKLIKKLDEVFNIIMNSSAEKN